MFGKYQDFHFMFAGSYWSLTEVQEAFVGWFSILFLCASFPFWWVLGFWYFRYQKFDKRQIGNITPTFGSMNCEDGWKYQQRKVYVYMVKIENTIENSTEKWQMKIKELKCSSAELPPKTKTPKTNYHWNWESSSPSENVLHPFGELSQDLHDISRTLLLLSVT